MINDDDIMIPWDSICDYDMHSVVIYYFDIMITGQIPSYDVMLGVIYDYDVIIPGGIGDYDMALTLQLSAPPCMKPEQTMFLVMLSR